MTLWPVNPTPPEALVPKQVPLDPTVRSAETLLGPGADQNSAAGGRWTDAQTAGGGWGGSGGAGGTAGANLQLSGFFGEYTTGNSWPMVGH